MCRAACCLPAVEAGERYTATRQRGQLAQAGTTSQGDSVNREGYGVIFYKSNYYDFLYYDYEKFWDEDFWIAWNEAHGIDMSDA